jgi:adenine phosphoribosyltransferase
VNAEFASSQVEREVRRLIRDIPDFPKPGIVFKDITPLLADANLFRRTTEAMAEPFQASRVTHVVGVESRGFILGAPVAQHLGAGFVPVRKPGKLPHSVEFESYELEYGMDRLEIHADAWEAPSRVLLVDDVLATGGTAEATCRLIERLGAQLVGCSFLMALSLLPGVERKAHPGARALITY